jgi:hypothetical protein
MVRIKLSPSKKRYLRGKHLYGYIRGHLPIPKDILTRLEPYFKEDFQAEIIEDSVKIVVTYTFFKKKNQEQNLTNRPASNCAAKVSKTNS